MSSFWKNLPAVTPDQIFSDSSPSGFVLTADGLGGASFQAGGGGGGGVTSLNGLSGALSLVAGSNITVTPGVNTITIAATSGSGTVTSVALALPASVFTVTGSPVTTSGTLTGSFNSQTANQFFAAPNGSSGTPTFRAILVADVPTLNQNTTGTASNITSSSNSTLTTLSALSLPTSQLSGTIVLTTQVSGVLPIANGGTDNGALSVAAGGVLYTDGTKVQNVGAGTSGQVLKSNGASAPSWTAAGGSGTVTSVAFSDGSTTPIYTISGSPVTTSGTITETLNTQSPNTVFAGPSSGGAAQPTFRSLISTDIPSISLTTGVTGVLPIANGGTNNSSAFTSGSVIFSNGTSLTQDNANFFWNDSNVSLGIGTNTPLSNTFIDGVQSSGAAKRIQLTGYGTGSFVGYRGRFARGTSGSPTAAQNGDILDFLSGQGYGATGFPTASTGVVNLIAGETFTDSSMLTYATIATTPTGSVTSAEAFRVATTGTTLGPQSGSTAIHNINGGLLTTTRTITANLTVDTTTSDYLILCNQAAGITVTLPTPTNGRTLIIKDISGTAETNNITIARHSTEQIEGIAASKILQTSYGSFTLVADGTNWWMV